MGSHPVPGNLDATRISSAVPAGAGSTPASTLDDATYVRPAVATAAAAEREPATLYFAIGLQAPDTPETAPINWETDLPVVHMLADLLSASAACAVRDEGDGLLRATVGSALRAVILAGRAQKLAEVYGHSPTATLRCLSIAVYAPSGNAPEDAALRSYLKASNRSGQVLLAGGVNRQLETVPGLQIRRVPVSSGQKLELHEMALPVVERPPQPVARRPKTAVQPQGQTASRPPVEASPTVLVDTVRSQPEPLPMRREEPRQDEPAASGGAKKIVIGAVAAVLLVGAGLAVKLSGSHTAAPAAVTKPAETAPAPVETAPAAAAPATVKAPAAERSVPAPMVEKKAAPVAVPKPAVEAPRDEAPAPAREPVIHGGGGYSAEQIRSILDKADTLAGNGKYDEAIRNYNVVLASDPGNGRAREGKARAVTNKNMQ